MPDTSHSTTLYSLKIDENWQVATPNLTILNFKPEHLTQEFVAALSDESINAYLEVRHNPPSFDNQVAFINNHLNDESAIYLALFEKAENKLVGSVRLSEISTFHMRATLGIVITDKNSWGRGFASEAIHAVTQFALRDLNLRRVSAGCYASNRGSLRAFGKCGYEVEGRLKDYWAKGTSQDRGGFEDQILMVNAAAESE